MLRHITYVAVFIFICALLFVITMQQHTISAQQTMIKKETILADRLAVNYERVTKLKKKDEFIKKHFSKLNPVYSEIVNKVWDHSLAQNIDPDLVMAVIEIESSYNIMAVSNKDCKGLMQINVKVWKKELKIEESKIFDIDYNIMLGIEILKIYIKKADNNIPLALSFYNGYDPRNRTIESYYFNKVLSANALSEKKQ